MRAQVRAPDRRRVLVTNLWGEGQCAENSRGADVMDVQAKPNSWVLRRADMKKFLDPTACSDSTTIYILRQFARAGAGHASVMAA